MPTIYIDRETLDTVREECDRIEREERTDDTDEVYVPERRGLWRLLSDEAQDRIEERRDDE